MGLTKESEMCALSASFLYWDDTVHYRNLPGERNEDIVS